MTKILYACSKCKSDVNSAVTKCWKCGAELNSETRCALSIEESAERVLFQSLIPYIIYGLIFYLSLPYLITIFVIAKASFLIYLGFGVYFVLLGLMTYKMYGLLKILFTKNIITTPNWVLIALQLAVGIIFGVVGGVPIPTLLLYLSKKHRKTSAEKATGYRGDKLKEGTL